MSYRQERTIKSKHGHTNSQIIRALKTSKGNKTLAAQSLGMPRSTYSDRLRTILGNTHPQRVAHDLEKAIKYEPKTVELSSPEYQVKHDPALRRVLFVPDTHIPFHDKQAFNLMIKAAKGFEPDVIVVIGDLADFYNVSSHLKKPSVPFNFAEEVVEVNRALDTLDSLGATKKIYLEGNHEDRLERYKATNAQAFSGLNEVTTKGLLHLKERDWEFVPYKQHTKIGKLYLAHDAGHSGKHSTSQTLNAYRHSVAFGHSHRMQMLVESDATGKQMVAMQCGWLGDRTKIEYMPQIKAVREWALGFGVGYMDKLGNVFCHPVPIVGYRCEVGGQLYAK